MAIADHPDQSVTTDGQRLLPVVNPATQEVIGTITITSPQGVAGAVQRARFARPAWGALSVKERTHFFRDWLDLLWERQSEGIAILRRENGKADSGAFLEFSVIDTITQYYIHHAPRILAPERRSALFPVIQRARVHHKPHGVVGVISPWNYPFLLAFVDLIPALIAGNTVVLKPSEITPFIAQFGVDLMHEVGIPRDVIQIVQGDGSTGAALVEQVDFVQFTGSTAVGRQVGMRAAERLIPYSLELGGKDPAIVLADADVEQTAIGLIRGAFENAGQACISVERVYIEEPIYDAVVERLKARAPEIIVGSRDGLDVTMGTMTNQAEIERTQAHIQDAVAKGAKIIYGGKPLPQLGPLFHEPTILVDVDHSMDIMREETFGPVLPIMKVKNTHEAIELANDTEYGLAATIFARDLQRAEQVAIQLDTGDVAVNRPHFTIGSPALPTGGQRNSGTGRRNGPEGLLKYTATQSVLMDTLIGAEEDLSTATPKAMQAFRILRAIRRYLPFV